MRWVRRALGRFSESKGTATLAVAMAISQVVLATTYAVAARHTTPTDFGLAVGLLAVASVLSGLVDFGMSGYLVREVASGRIGVQQAGDRLARRLGLVALLVLLASAVTFSIDSVSEVRLSGPVLAVGVVLASTVFAQSAQVAVRAYGRMRLLSAATLADRFAGLFLVVLAIQTGLSPLWVLVAAVAGGQLTNGITCLLGMRYARPAKLVRAIGRLGAPSRWLGSWRGSTAYGAAALAGSSQQIDVTLLGVVGGADAAGQYGAVSRWTQPLVLPATALSQSVVGAVAAAASSASAVKIVVRQSWLLALGVAASVFVAVFAAPITEFVLGPEYSASAIALAVLAIATVPTLVAQPFAMILQSRGQDRSMAYSMWSALALRLLVVAVLGGALGALGAALGVLMQQLLMLAIILFLTVRLLRGERK